METRPHPTLSLLPSIRQTEAEISTLNCRLLTGNAGPANDEDASRLPQGGGRAPARKRPQGRTDPQPGTDRKGGRDGCGAEGMKRDVAVGVICFRGYSSLFLFSSRLEHTIELYRNNQTNLLISDFTVRFGQFIVLLLFGLSAWDS